jgi:hypothetical protein
MELRLRLQLTLECGGEAALECGGPTPLLLCGEAALDL